MNILNPDGTKKGQDGSCTALLRFKKEGELTARPTKARSGKRAR
jgi:hypothetical protein